MLAKVKSMSLYGLDGVLVSVEVDVSSGMPSWDVVGLPDTSIRESKERVRTAIKNSNIELSSKKIIINLAPADTKKEGSFFDLPISVGILLGMGIVDLKQDISKTAFIGELSLDGNLNKITGVLPMCIEAEKLGLKRIILPYDNAKEASIVKNLEIIGIKNLSELVNYLNKTQEISPTVFNDEDISEIDFTDGIDFSDVKGQENIKRALEIAAAGGHNCLLIGSPGSGKTMLARRLPTILPDLTFKESLETTKIHSVAGILKKDTPLVKVRPFRAPHHTISGVSLVGGGRVPKPGEISLAHNGVLFLDELPEFNKSTLEVMRGPLEDGNVTISRVNASLTYPCNFMFIASMNPCPCGYYGSKEKDCMCSDSVIQKYMGRVSGPLLDRIDIQIEVSPVKFKKFEEKTPIETSHEIKQRVNNARVIQIKRYTNENIYSNSQLSAGLIEKYCKLDEESYELLKKSFEKLGLSARAYSRILKVSRTIADLDGKENIEKSHIAEAIQYRNLDRKYWKN